MLVSDAQKYYTLKYKKGLISDGMFYATRNPNYLGEIMLYRIFDIIYIYNIFIQYPSQFSPVIHIAMLYYLPSGAPFLI